MVMIKPRFRTIVWFTAGGLFVFLSGLGSLMYGLMNPHLTGSLNTRFFFILGKVSLGLGILLLFCGIGMAIGREIGIKILKKRMQDYIDNAKRLKDEKEKTETG